MAKQDIGWQSADHKDLPDRMVPLARRVQLELRDQLVQAWLGQLARQVRRVQLEIKGQLVQAKLDQQAQPERWGRKVPPDRAELEQLAQMVHQEPQT